MNTHLNICRLCWLLMHVSSLWGLMEGGERGEAEEDTCLQKRCYNKKLPLKQQITRVE